VSFVINVLRSKDLLNLQFEFINLVVDSADIAAPRLKRATAGDAFIIVRLPPQHIAEQVIRTSDDRHFPYEAFIASPSRLAFQLPATPVEIPFNLRSVLRYVTDLPLKLTTALPADGKPATVIEFPDRLLLIPDSSTRLFHRWAPLKRNVGPVSAELWHTRIGVQGDSKGKNPLHLRAVTNPQDLQDRPGLRSTLTRQDRANIVSRSNNPLAHPIGAERFTLTALGATAQLRSNWQPDLSATLSAWEHDTGLARDRYVRVVRQYFLFPFGHRVAIETIVRREFFVSNPAVAELQGRSTPTVQEWEKSYDSREMPFKVVRIGSMLGSTTLTSGRKAFDFTATAVDGDGNLVDCALTMLLVSIEELRNPSTLGTIKGEYERDGHNVVELNYQRVALADTAEGRGDTKVDIASLRLGAKILQPSDLDASGRPPFLPYMLDADVSIPSIERLRSSIGGPTHRGARTPIKIRYTDRYKNSGFQPSDSKQVFAEFVGEALQLSIPTERAGGLAALHFPGINGLSRTMGPISDVQNFMAGSPTGWTIGPEDLLGNAKLLGSILLSKIVDMSATSATEFLLASPEKLFKKIEEDDNFFLARPVMTTVRTPSANSPAIETRFAWSPKIKPFGALQLRAAGVPIRLTATGKITTSDERDRDAVSFEVDGRLKNFALSLGGLLTASFNQVEFKIRPGRKMEVKTDLAAIGFQSTLAFAQVIQGIIPVGTLGGAFIRPQPDGVVVGYAFAIPTAATGVLSFQNIAFISSISFPFVEGPPAAARFSLSERSHPFMVSVAPFGGTGFFALEARTNDTVQVEAAIEFGGIISINLLGIVRGGVYVLAGVYVSIQSHAEPAISAHLRFGGYVDVLGIVSVSIEFYLGLTFVSPKLVGEARVTVGVRVLFFSKTISFTVHKEIDQLGAIPRTPQFVALIAKEDWEKYCKAFA